MAMFTAMKLGINVITILSNQDKPAWMDFALTPQELILSVGAESFGWLNIPSNQSNMFLRKFSIHDIDELHLKKLNTESQPCNTGESAAIITFNSVYKNLLENKIENLHLLSINFEHRRIGFLKYWLDDINYQAKLEIIFYDEYFRKNYLNEVLELMRERIKNDYPDYKILVLS